MSAKYRYEFIPYEDFAPIFDAHQPILFANTNTIDVNDCYSQQERDAATALRERQAKPFGLCVLAYDGDKMIGWSVGDQENAETFYMRNSAVYPEYRRQGVYDTLMRMIVDRAVKEGFQRICSRHLATNNGIIIPKLKFGFLISGIEISDKHGTMVRLTYYANKKREHILRYRTGEAKSPEQSEQ